MLRNIILITKKQPPKLDKLMDGCIQRGVRLYTTFPEEVTLLAETLYITDTAEIYRGLREEFANVLVWLHEDNREQDFSMASYAVEEIEEADYTYFEKVYLRFRGLPWTVAETKRCIIREMTEEDVEDLYRIYQGKNITKYMEALYEDPEEERQFVRAYIKNAYEYYGYGTWVICRKENNRLIGRVGFNLREGFEEPELGFVIGEEYQRQGYARECCEAVISLGKEEYEFDQIQVLIKEENLPSLMLSEKLGFTFEEKVLWEKEEYLRYLKKL